MDDRELLRRLHDWFLEAAPEHYAGCGLYFDVNESLAAAPEPLRVAEGPEIVAALTTAQTLMMGSGYWRNEAGYLTDAALWIERAISAAEHLSVRVAGEEVERLRELVGKHLGPHLAISPTPRYEAVVNEFVRSVLALIEPSAGGGDRLVPVRVNDEWPFPMPVPPPVQDLRYGMYLNLRDMVRAAYRRRHLDPRLGHFIETNYADYLATFDEIDLALSPTPDQPKPEVKDV